MADPHAINLTDPTLAATLEIIYLHQTLLALAEQRPTAIDVGAHRGDVTAALSDLGFRVLTVEPQPPLAARLAERFGPLIECEQIHIERCAASDRRGVAKLYVGSASTVNTLEQDWTRIAFPEEFKSPETLDVPLYTLAELTEASGFSSPAFVKIDVEGHELPALRGLFQGATNGAAAALPTSPGTPGKDRGAGIDQPAPLSNTAPTLTLLQSTRGGEKDGSPPPSIIMFEANQRFPEAARQCLDLLAEQGYDRFDIFIRDGIAPIAAGRFYLPRLPAAWLSCRNKYFYANIIAYHRTLPGDLLPSAPTEFLETYQLEAARKVLRRGVRLEQTNAVPVHPIWSEARSTLRSYLEEEDWRDFLSHPVCRQMFFRGRWGAGQDKELAALSADVFGQMLLDTQRDPAAGAPRLSHVLPELSTNMLGMFYYLMRVRKACDDALPRSVIEIGGGYGAFAWAFMKQNPQAAYIIVDLPEMLAIQHYFLTLSLPQSQIIFADTANAQPMPGRVLLLPAARLHESALSCDLLFSTFGFSELPREFQARIEATGYFGASRIFLAGQFASELPHLHLVHHDQVLRAARRRFNRVNVERFHTGDNYLLIGSQSAA